MKQPVTWILLADGAQARVLNYTGPGKGLHQVEGLDFSEASLSSQELVSDRPGRTASASGTHSAIQPKTDPKDHRETEFVKSLAGMLDRQLQAKAFERLVIVASPIALGVIRKAISPAVKDTVLAELDKDLTNLPTAQLEKHLDGVFAV